MAAQTGTASTQESHPEHSQGYAPELELRPETADLANAVSNPTDHTMRKIFTKADSLSAMTSDKTEAA